MIIIIVQILLLIYSTRRRPAIYPASSTPARRGGWPPLAAFSARALGEPVAREPRTATTARLCFENGS
jgi:hypothetical protein